MPQAPSPKFARLRYFSRISFFEYCFSTAIAYRSSATLRWYVSAVASATSSGVFAFSTRLTFTYCWVMLEPPCWIPPEDLFCSSARRVPLRSSAPCS